MRTAERFIDAGLPAIGPLGERLHDVRRIAVLRAGGLGDLLFALPAVRALAAAYPEAEVTLLGTRLAAELLEGRPGVPHLVRPLPPIPGVGAGADARVDEDRVAAFVAEQRRERYDLAAQFHGGGRFSNALLRELGAGCTIGAVAEGAPGLDRGIDHVYYQHEIVRWLEVAGLVGAPPVELEPRLDATETELEFGLRRCGGAGQGRDSQQVVAVHPGATDPRRRWPVECFAELVSALARDGVRTVLVGSGEEERRLCADIGSKADLGGSASGLVDDASGRLSISELVGVLAAADAMVGNDSGPRHLAQAVGTRTASVFWAGNVINAGPLGRDRHRVQISWTTRCPVCERDCTRFDGSGERCEHDVSFVGDVAADAVLADVRRLLAAARDEAGGEARGEEPDVR